MTMSTTLWLAGGALVLSAAALLLACVAHSRVSGVATASDAGSSAAAVVVLGYPTLRSGSPHPVQRWRTDLAARTAVTHRATVVVFTGAGRAGRPSEAEVMSGLAERLELGDAEIRLEVTSTSTWENVLNAGPLVDDVDCVVLVSDPLHAARARSYWFKQRPDDVGRVFVTDQCGFWDGWWLKPPTALNALRQWAIGRLRPL